MRITVFLQLTHRLIHSRLHRIIKVLTGSNPCRAVQRPRSEPDLFRSRAVEILRDSDWLDEGVHYWLQKELRREPGYIYTENEHAALARIIAAGTLFDGWDGYSVPELLTAAYQYKTDGDYEDEQVFDELQARHPAQLRLGEIGRLVSFCRNLAGLPLAPFRPEIARYEDTV